MSEFGPKCESCVDYYLGECHCLKSVYCGMSMPNLPWDGCTGFLSRRKWGRIAKQNVIRNIRAWRNSSSEYKVKL